MTVVAFDKLYRIGVDVGMLTLHAFMGVRLGLPSNTLRWH